MMKQHTCPECGRGACFIVGLSYGIARCFNGHRWRVW